MKNCLRIVFVVLVGVVSTAWAVQADRITTAIDSSQSVVVKGTVYGRALPQYDQGRVDPAMKLSYITLQIAPSPAQQAALDKLLAAQQDPTSKSYHQWLTPEQFGAQSGLSRSDVTRITNWLQSQGFTIVQTARSRNWIAFSGTAAQVETTFHTQIHHFTVDGEKHYANATDISLPKALAGVVTSVRGLHDFRWKPFYVRRHPAEHLLSPDYTSGSTNFLAPNDIATIYDIKPLIAAGYDGTGVNLVIIGQSDVATSDITDFRSGFSLPAINLTRVVPAGTSGCVNPGPVGGDEVESDLDLEWSGAVAQNAAIIFDICDQAHGGVFTALQDAVTNNRGPVISLSYGGCEPVDGPNGGYAFFRGIVQQANLSGITFMASAGDSGAAACDASGSPQATQGLAVNLPASVPETTAVGGSEFNEGGNNSTYWGSGTDFGSALKYIPEEGWNDTPLGGLASTGGGVSIGYTKPSWQTGTGVPNDGFRDVPDVTITASAAHDGYIFCTSGSCAPGGATGIQNAINSGSIVGGTSASSPVFAGIVTLLNQYLVKNGGTAGLGNINMQLYPYAASNPSAFHDITQGNNIVPCQQGSPGCPASAPFQYGYSAGPGYDQVTGLGSVDAYNFVTGWGGALRPTTTTVTPPTTAVNYKANTNVAITATVKPTAGSGTPTGTVTFYITCTDTQANCGTLTSGTAVSIGTETLSSGTATLTGGYSTSALHYNTNGKPYSITATYGGDSSFAGSTSAAATLNVQYFTLAASPTTVTITAPGQGGSTVVTATTYGNLSASSLTFSCSTGLPSESSCAFGTVGSNGTVSVSISTTAASDLRWPQLGHHQRLFYALLLPGFLGVVSMSGRRRTWRGLRLLALIVLLGLPALWLACGGGSSGTSHNPGTPTGTSPVTISATTASALQNTTTFTLTVQ